MRKRYLAEHLAPIEEQRIEIDVPVDMSLRPTPVATENGAPTSGWDRRSTGDQQSSSRAAAYLSPRRAAFVYAFVMSGMNVAWALASASTQSSCPAFLATLSSKSARRLSACS